MSKQKNDKKKNGATEQFRLVIKAMLDQRAEVDPLFAEVYAKESKSIEQCCDYIMGEVERMGVNAMSDDEVIGLAVHYYDEDDVKVRPSRNVRVVVPETPEIAEARKAELIKEAEAQFVEAQKKRMAEAVEAKRKPAKKTEASQVPTLDLFAQ